jgi:GT2 family glycosyltransferase
MDVPQLAVVIATRKRPETLGATLLSLSRQTWPVTHVYVSACLPEDVPAELHGSNIRVIFGPPGGSVQRNRAIRQVPGEVPYVAFFDDDVELHPTYLEKAITFLESNRDVVAISGRMLADGYLSRVEARRLIQEDQSWTGPPHLQDSGRHYILYACNAIVRSEPLRQTLFDENLPLYSYGEDYDLSLRLLKFGRVGRLSHAIGVHLQAANGRVSGKRYGYAMIANNWYFLRKGVCHLAAPWSYLRFALVVVLKRILINLGKGLSRQWQKDPWGQVQGNLLALADILMGRSSPKRILEL